MSTAPSVAAGYAARSLDELPSLWDGFAKLVRAGLGITAFGAQVMDLPPDYTTESPDGMRVLCIGSVPGAPYTPPPWTGGDG